MNIGLIFGEELFCSVDLSLGVMGEFKSGTFVGSKFSTLVYSSLILMVIRFWLLNASFVFTPFNECEVH